MNQTEKELGGSGGVPGAGSGAAAGGGGGGPPLATGLAHGGVLDDHRGEDGLLVPPGQLGGRPEPRAEQVGAVLGRRRPMATRRGSRAAAKVSGRHP